MNEELFKPSLETENINDTMSYDINKIGYIAFFLGPIPTYLLMLQNERWLNDDEKINKIMLIPVIFLLILKVILVLLYIEGLINIQSNIIRLFTNGLSVVYYLFYFNMLKEKFEVHMNVVGETEPLLKDSFKYGVIGGLIEVIVFLIFLMVFKILK